MKYPTDSPKKAGAWLYDKGANVLSLDGKNPSPLTWKKNGWQDNRQDVEVVKKMPWDRRDGVGVISGIGGWRCIDLDGIEGEGVKFGAVEKILDAFSFPHTYPWIIESGSGEGYHIWFRCEGDEAFDPRTDYDPKREGAFDHLELRWANHQTAVPPTVHPVTGMEYEFRKKHPERKPWEVNADEVQAALDAVAKPSRSSDGQPGMSSFDAPETIPKGKRNNKLTSFAGYLRQKGLTGDEMLPMVEHFNQSRCSDPLSPDEVADIVESVSRYEPEDPELKPVRSGLSEPSELSEPNEPSESLEWKPFPTEVLPSEAQEYVRAHSKAKNVDEAMVAAPSLGALAGAVGNSREIELKRSWTEHSTLWILVAAPSGKLKTQSFQAGIAPVNDLEVEAKREHEKKVAAYEEQMERYKSLSQEERAEKEPPEEPNDRRRYRVSNTTIEALIDRHSDNPRGLLLARDELAGWIGSFDQYTQAESDLQSWIEMYEGRLVQSDRKTSGTTDIENPNVTVVGTTQPHVLQNKLTDLHFHSGFEARMMILSPPGKERRFTTHDVTKEVDAAYTRLIRRLYRMRSAEDETPSLSLSDGAEKVFADFYNRNAKIQEQLPDGPLRSKLSKIEAVAARTALILQLADDPKAKEVSKNAMVRGTLLAEWFRHESARLHNAYNFRENTLTRDERCAQQLPDVFNWRDVKDVWDIGRRGAMKACNRLVEKGLATDQGKGKGYKLATKAKVSDFTSVMKGAAPNLSDVPGPMPKHTGDSSPDEVPF